MVSTSTKESMKQEKDNKHVGIESGYQRVKKAFKNKVGRDLEFRKTQLRGIKRMLVECEEEVCCALQKDLGRPRMESLICDIAITIADIDHILENLSSWMLPQSVATPLALLPGNCFIQDIPIGVVLVIAPFNYPVQLSLSPLCAALAAGNTAVLKTSELCPNVSTFLADTLPRYVDQQCLEVVEGGVEESQYLLGKEFQHIFFTGSERVGRIVAKAAAEYLTPTTLELGGKCPAVVHKDCDIELAARRIMWSKWLNAGQTCLATDYVLVHEDIAEQFTETCVEMVKEFGKDSENSGDESNSENDLQKSKSFSRIVSEQHTKRLASLIDESGGNIEYGGKSDVKDRYVSPTILTQVPEDSPVMQEELFGPVLPILEYSELDEALEIISKHPTPLAVYIFTKSSDIHDQVGASVISGGLVVNDCMMHVGNPELPFGGIGTSGVGNYHGIHGFKAMTHQRAVLKATTLLDPWIRYPPYTSLKMDLFRKAVSTGWITSSLLLKLFTLFCLTSAVAVGPILYSKL